MRRSMYIARAGQEAAARRESWNLLDQFMETGAISQEQHDKSLHDLIEKMGEN